MQIEFEVKVLDINVDEVQQNLEKLGAVKEPEVLMRRWIFDNLDPANFKEEWLRLRDDGKKVTLTYKHHHGCGVCDTEELEVEVVDFDKTAEILSKFFSNQYYQENKRTVFKLNGIEFCIDFWPKIPAYLEVESSSEEKVKEGLKLLGIKKASNPSVREVYLKYGIDIHSFKELKF
ncbi:CYTH domain-containing protein [Candidatus Woesearchaeota archaeon]|nr:CYTH domain-containing protein [Candidatus Woesearchaeota archaeon]